MHRNFLKIEAVIWLISSKKCGLDVSRSSFGRELCMESQKTAVEEPKSTRVLKYMSDARAVQNVL